MRHLPLLLPLALAACVSPADGPPPEPAPAEAPAPPEPRTFPLFDGHTGELLAWDDLVERAGAAEVVFLGELHDDGPGHAAQRELFVDVARRFPGTALSLEMLERDEQARVDDFLDGFVDGERLAGLTSSDTAWGDGAWAKWYQPILDAARDAAAPIVAANAPRRYVRAARTDGYERLRELPPERAAHVALPTVDADEAYLERFREAMSGHGTQAPEEDATDEPGETDETENATELEQELDPEAAEAAAERERRLLDAFRAQQVWDATMAESIVRALDAGSERVVHLVGRFHTDFDGGTVQQLRALRPDTRVLTVSLAPHSATELREEDLGRADVVVYTRTVESVD